MGLDKIAFAGLTTFSGFYSRGLLFSAAALLMVSLASLGSALDQICEVLSHFVYLYVLVSVIILTAAVLKRAKLAAVFSLIALLIATARLVPDSVPEKTADQKQTFRDAVSIVEFNCWGPKNKRPEAISTLARENKADIVCFCEVEGKQKKNIDKNFTDYPYKVIFPYNCGEGVVSKLPIVKQDIRVAEYDVRPRMIVTVRLRSGKDLSILVVHPTIPLYRARFEGRNKEFELYASDLASLPGPKMIVGDLNCTPWSYYFARLLKSTGLRDSEKGFGDQPSWPAGINPVPFLPIDHVLVSPDLVVTERKILPEAGSDHRPVLVRLGVLK